MQGKGVKFTGISLFKKTLIKPALIKYKYRGVTTGKGFGGFHFHSFEAVHSSGKREMKERLTMVQLNVWQYCERWERKLHNIP